MKIEQKTLALDYYSTSGIHSVILVDQEQKKCIISSETTSIDDSIYCPLSVKIKRPNDFNKILAKSQSLIGKKNPSKDWIRIPNDIYGINNNTYHCIDFRYLYRGKQCVPPQNESWTCGVNSAARFAAMIGQAIYGYPDFMENAPHYFGGILPKIGGNAQKITNYIRQQPELAGTEIYMALSTNYSAAFGVINQAIEKKRPVMVLVLSGGASLHWVNIIGKNKLSGNYIILNTNSNIYEIPGENHGLIQNMCLSGHIAEWARSVKNYNLITCLSHLNEKDILSDNKFFKYTQQSKRPPYLNNKPHPGFKWDDGTYVQDDKRLPLTIGNRHIVQIGDNLTKISSINNVKISLLLPANPQIANPNLIYPGQIVYVPPGDGTIMMTDPSFRYYKKYHLVKKGESLWSIANDYNVTLSTIQNANSQISNFDHIIVHQKINIPW